MVAMMNRFPLPLRVELSDDRTTWSLLAPFAYIDPEHGRIDVPAGDKTDFASVRPVRTIGLALVLLGLALGLLGAWAGSILVVAGIGALLLYAAVVGYGTEAAVLHDHIYRTRRLPRAKADAVFFNALRSSAHARWRSRLMWLGVRTGGWKRYGKT
jgi:hypothetical protein